VKSRIAVLLAVVFVLCLFMAGCGRTPVSPPAREAGGMAAAGLAVHYIDVGQGDAILIRTPQQAILIDSGDVVQDKREHPVVTYLKNQGITTLDAIIITHPHADHLGGIQPVLAAFPVKRIYDSGQTTTTRLYKQYLLQVKQLKVPFTVARAGTQAALDDGVKLDFLSPPGSLLTDTASDLNNNSLVVRLVYGDISFLFVGDIEKEGESRLLKQGGSFKSTILKVGHHGSSTSGTAAFLKAVAPETAIIMCGVDNDYHHPHPGTLKKLERAQVKVYRTDLQGSIIVMTDGRQYTVKVEK